ncbi:MAG: O-acetylserine lyase, partial [Acidobacteriota bacterium]
GWSPDFIPKLTEDAVNLELIDQIVPINSGEAVRLSRELARREGIFTGISGGATFAGALEICRQAPEGSTVLCMLPDTGERYLTTQLFEDIPEVMTDEENAISQSTPNYRFDVAPDPAVASLSAVIPVTPEAQAFVAEAIADPDHPVVMFALEWCEFCWSVRKLFAACGIPYRSIDLDSAAYQKDDWGGKIRAALQSRTSSRTVPQVFIGGEFVGGCTEVFAAFTEGRLQSLLSENDVSYDPDVTLDPHALLPSWLHPR